MQTPHISQFPLCNSKGQLCVLISAEDEGGVITLFNTETGRPWLRLGALDAGGSIVIRNDEGWELDVDAKGGALYPPDSNECVEAWPERPVREIVGGM